MKEKIKKEICLLYSSRAQSDGGKRITCVDMARGIAIILVVMGHSGVIGESWNTWLSTFHLPAFFFISGLLMQYKKEEETKLRALIIRKARGIMLPYFYFSMGTIPFIIFAVLRGNFGWEVLGEFALKTVTFQGYSVLWFLPVLFLSEVLMIILIKIMKLTSDHRMIVAAMSCVFATIFAFGAYYGYAKLVSLGVSGILADELRVFVKPFIAVAIMCYGFFVAEIFSTLTHEGIAPKNTKRFHWFGLLMGIGLSMVNILVVPLIQLMDLNNANVGNLTVYLLLGVAGSVGLFLICRSIPNISLLTFYGRNTLIIMCTHLNFYVFYVSLIVGQFLSAVIPGEDSVQLAIISLLICMLLEIPVILFIRIFLPFTLGRKMKKKSKDR